MFEVSFSQASRLNSFFFCFCPPKVCPVVCVSLYRVRSVLSFCLFAFPLVGKAEWGGHPVCWWFGLYFYFVCCLDEASCIECCWWLDSARSCVKVILFVWVLTIWYSLGLVLWFSRILESVFLIHRLRAWSLVRSKESIRGSLWH